MLEGKLEYYFIMMYVMLIFISMFSMNKYPADENESRRFIFSLKAYFLNFNLIFFKHNLFSCNCWIWKRRKDWQEYMDGIKLHLILLKSLIVTIIAGKKMQIRNSWGPRWGDKGYIYMERGNYYFELRTI